MDIKSAVERSKNMAHIKSKGTTPEYTIRALLYKRGFHYRLNYSKIEGHPDLYVRRYNVAIFIHGCFWHRHENCHYAYMPKTNMEFWNQKFAKNVERDAQVKAKLASQGIRILIVWECSIKKAVKEETTKEYFTAQLDSLIKDKSIMFFEI